MVIGRFCDEFHCLPSAAMDEWRRSPVGFLETIIEMREYVKAKRIFETAPSAQALPASPLIDLVRTFTFELVEADLAQRR